MPISEAAHEFLDALDMRDLVAIEAFLSEDFQLGGNINHPMGKGSMLALLNAYYTAFSDFAFNFADATQFDEVLNVNYAITGTHDGPLDFTPLGIQLRVEASGTAIAMPQSASEITFNEAGQVVSQVLTQAEGATMTGLVALLGAELPPAELG